jgi:2-polyprenyl-3-methyl-5-hydroxy-6-metoxy-1,4-benzoquinol methylase
MRTTDIDRVVDEILSLLSPNSISLHSNFNGYVKMYLIKIQTEK